MLPKSAKIRPSYRVLQVIQKGRKIHGPLFSLRILANRAKNDRFAVVVSKKIAKRAVDRNRIRRLMYETLRELPPSSPLSPREDIVIMCAPGIAKCNFHDILTALTDIFSKRTL